MGMDVYGKNPRTETGRYFRNSVWWWRPLAQYACEVAPNVTTGCTYWHTNDGDGLNKRDSNLLADLLQAELDSGRCEAYAQTREAELAALPDETCYLCEGTGTRQRPPHTGAGKPASGIVCNRCAGKGVVRPDATVYPFEVDNVRAFVAFLRDCGGFQIC